MERHMFHLKMPRLRKSVDLRVFRNDFEKTIDALSKSNEIRFSGSVEVYEHEFVIISDTLTDVAARWFGRIFAASSILGNYVKAYHYNEGNERSGQLFIRVKD